MTSGHIQNISKGNGIYRTNNNSCKERESSSCSSRLGRPRSSTYPYAGWRIAYRGAYRDSQGIDDRIEIEIGRNVCM
jgi:hypothetical protein